MWKERKEEVGEVIGNDEKPTLLNEPTIEVDWSKLDIPYESVKKTERIQASRIKKSHRHIGGCQQLDIL